MRGRGTRLAGGASLSRTSALRRDLSDALCRLLTMGHTSSCTRSSSTCEVRDVSEDEGTAFDRNRRALSGPLWRHLVRWWRQSMRPWLASLATSGEVVGCVWGVRLFSHRLQALAQLRHQVRVHEVRALSFLGRHHRQLAAQRLMGQRHGEQLLQQVLDHHVQRALPRLSCAGRA